MTEAALVLRNSFRVFSVSYDGCPTIGDTVGWGNPSMILSAEDMVVLRTENRI